jgi:hypothetical protein
MKLFVKQIVFVKLQTFAVVHNVALVFFMGDYPACG